MTKLVALRALYAQLADSPTHAEGHAALGAMLGAVDERDKARAHFDPIELAYLRCDADRPSPAEYLAARDDYFRADGALEAILRGVS